MSIIIKRNTEKIAILLKQERKLFHTDDLMLLWNIDNRESLRRTISRYSKKGVLKPVYRGFYTTVPLSRLDPLEIGSSVIHTYCYVSTETVLERHSIIFQENNAYTYCSKDTKQMLVGDALYRSRRLNDVYLYNNAGIIRKKNYLIASLERAIADMLYFNPHYYFDGHNQIDWEKVKEVQKEVGYR